MMLEMPTSNILYEYKRFTRLSVVLGKYFKFKNKNTMFLSSICLQNALYFAQIPYKAVPATKATKALYHLNTRTIAVKWCKGTMVCTIAPTILKKKLLEIYLYFAVSAQVRN
jgi:hypothetical protein